MTAQQNLTTSAGVPVGDKQNSLSTAPRGPESMQEWLMIEKPAHH